MNSTLQSDKFNRVNLFRTVVGSWGEMTINFSQDDNTLNQEFLIFYGNKPNNLLLFKRLDPKTQCSVQRSLVC
jgi:hypothetical protein